MSLCVHVYVCVHVGVYVCLYVLTFLSERLLLLFLLPLGQCLPGSLVSHEVLQLPHLGQPLQGLPQQVGAVIQDHVAELQVHVLPSGSPLGVVGGVNGGLASCKGLPALPVRHHIKT